MEKRSSTAVAPLIYNGHVVRMKGEMISLTDMWKAAGSPANKEPYNWARKEGAAFIEAVAVAHNLTDGQVMITKKGKGGGTFAHWQTALAYAKYLDHAFHMWCNTVVRERMEGHGGSPVSIADDERSLSVIGNMIKRCSGVVIRDELATALPKLVDEVVRRVATDNRNIATANVSIREVLDQMHVPSRKRRRLQARVFVRLRTHCLLKGIGAVQCVRTGTWLWPVVEATAFIRDECADLIRQHRESIDRQGRLNLVPREPPG